MKIVAGSLRGRAIHVGGQARPTSGRSKEALFSRWQESVPGSLFLDLFAGSGGMGLEAVSRGARQAVLVERGGPALRTLRSNCERLAPENCVVIRAVLPEMPDEVLARAPFDHVYADPPYDFEAYEPLMAEIAGVLRHGAEMAIEHSSRRRPGEVVGSLAMTNSRRYGETSLSFYLLDSPPATSRG